MEKELMGNLRLVFDDLDALLAYIKAPDAILLNLKTLVDYFIVDFV